jgi:hypothetical protein
MSWNPAIEPGCPDDVGHEAIEILIVPCSRVLGDFGIRRALAADGGPIDTQVTRKDRR